MDIICHPSEWIAWAQRHQAALLGPVAILGEMGVGKTTAVKYWLQALGSRDSGSSPTFTLIQPYDSPHGVIYHADFYRLDDAAEGESLGLDEIFDSGQPMWMEWPQKITNLLPDELAILRIDIQGDGCRKVTLETNP